MYQISIVQIRRQKYIEFTFSTQDRLLGMDMVMPVEAFLEFCRVQKVEKVHVPDDMAFAYHRLVHSQQNRQLTAN